MKRFIRSNGVILIGLLLAFYGVVSSAAALGQVEVYNNTDLVLEQAMEAQSLPQEPASEPIRPAVYPALLAEEAAQEPEIEPEVSLASRALKELSDSLLSEKWLPPAVPTLPAPPPVPEEPLRIVIPAIELDAPVLPAKTYFVDLQGKSYQQWLAPDKFAAGWHADSARLGEPGNTVLNGHNNISGEVFRDLEDLSTGDTILVYGEEYVHTYLITNHMLVAERFQQIDIRMENARWILPSQDERLTLITCWPYDSNTHRLIIVAQPISHQKLAPKLQHK